MTYVRAPIAAALLLCLAAPRAQAAPAHPPTVSATSSGIRLTMTVPRHNEPRGSLLRVSLRYTNITNHPLTEVRTMVDFCNQTIAVVNDLNATGNPVDPLPRWPGPYPPCAAPMPFSLKPGETVQAVTFAVLLTGRLQAQAYVNSTPQGASFNGALLATPILTLALSAGQVRHRRVLAPPGTRTLRLVRPHGARGPLHYREWSTCNTHVLVWTTPADDGIPVGCAAGGEWHVVAGWANRPVIVIDGTSATP